MSDTTDIKFSVVIPTRERAATLKHCLRTCLDQNFDAYEVIVSDNYSSSATRAVVDEAASSKVRYFRTPGPLAMSSNWEFGVSHARGEYVILIGDDDGLLPYALKELDTLTRQSHAKAIRWDAAYYTWPSLAIAGQGNYLRIPLDRGLREIDSMEAIREVIGFRSFYTSLPMLYNAAVHRDVLATLREKTGRVFPYAIPDVYSGFAVAAVAGSFLSTDVPMSVSGQSGASNGIATLFQRGQSTIDKEFRDFNSRESLLPDPRVPDLPVFPHVPVADTFLYAKQCLFPQSDVNLDRRQFVAGCVGNLRVKDEAEWRWALGLLRKSLNDAPALQAWFDAELANSPFRIHSPHLRPDTLGFDGEYMHLDAVGFGVVDVAGASLLCERILNYGRDGVSYIHGEMSKAKRANEQLYRVCQERLELIDRLTAQLVKIERGGLLKRVMSWVKQRIVRMFSRLSPMPR